MHHNYFHDFTSPGGNGAETIRWGLSGLSLSTGDGLCEYNLFVRCEGENEMISNKSSGNAYRYNTVLDCDGGEISQRHGNDCLYYGNFMRNTQGMRIYGDRHKIFCNYFESNSIGVNMGNGDGDVYAGDALTSHDRPDDNVVVFNAFINNATHYEMGGRTDGLGSSNTVVANNIFQGGGNMASISSTAPYTGSWSNNIRWNTSSAGNMPASGYTNVNPLLTADANGLLHIQSGSPAINKGVGAYDFYGVYSSFSYVTADMDGQPRDASKDIGADEFSSAPVVARILTTNDVGPYSFAGNFGLAPAPSSRTVPPGVATNVSYMINVNDLTGANDTVTFSVAGLPANSAGIFAPATVTGSGSSSLNLTVSDTAPSGYYTLTITGTSTNTTNFTTVALFIVRPPANLRWNSTSSPTWDVTTTANWFNLSNSAADVFVQGDSVLFSDIANAITSITFGGTLSLTNLGGTLAAGDNFKLFFAGSYSGAFTNLVPPMPGSGLSRSTGTLTVDGTLRVAVATRPVIASLALAGVPPGGIVFSGTNGVPDANYYVLASTNRALPFAQWTRVATNVFSAGGLFSFTNNATGPQQFYAVQLP